MQVEANYIKTFFVTYSQTHVRFIEELPLLISIRSLGLQAEIDTKKIFWGRLNKDVMQNARADFKKSPTEFFRVYCLMVRKTETSKPSILVWFEYARSKMVEFQIKGDDGNREEQ